MNNFFNVLQPNLKEASLSFGKYKNVPISKIPDAPYLEWAIQQKWIDKNIREALQDRLNIVQYNNM